MTVCDKLENVLEEHVRWLEEFQYRLTFGLYMSEDVEHTVGRKNRRRKNKNNKSNKGIFSLLNPNKLLKAFGLRLVRVERLKALEERARRPVLRGQVVLPLRARLHANHKMLTLLRIIMENPKSLVEACELYADIKSKEAFVDYTLMTINAALSLSPYTKLRTVRAVYPPKMRLEKYGIRLVGEGDYLPLYSIRDEFMIECTEVLVKEVFAFENYKYDEIGVVPKDDSVYVDVGAYVGETVAWFSMYASNSMIYAIEGSDKVLTALKRNLMKDRAGSIIERQNNKVEIVNKFITKDVSLTQLLKLPRDFNHIMLKSDIEGYEHDLLIGSKDFFAEYKPEISMAAYHRGDDLITLPKLLLRANEGYKFYLRPSLFAGSVVLFAK